MIAQSLGHAPAGAGTQSRSPRPVDCSPISPAATPIAAGAPGCGDGPDPTCSPMAKPGRRRDARSSTEAKYSLPSSVGTSVRSPHHFWLISSALKSRLSDQVRDGSRGLVGAGQRAALALRAPAWRPWRAIESATVFFDTFQPFSTRSSHTLGGPVRARVASRVLERGSHRCVKRHTPNLARGRRAVPPLVERRLGHRQRSIALIADPITQVERGQVDEPGRVAANGVPTSRER